MHRLLTLLFVLNIIQLTGQECVVKKNMKPEKDFQSITQFANMDIKWYDEWLEHTGGKKILPEPLKPQEKWDHPYMKSGYTAAMHEGPRSSDVSNRPGPTLKNIKTQYFHVLQKGGDFSGMCPTFAFINDSTMATLSFGRATTTLLLLDVKDTISVLDQVRVPGRGSSAFELAGKKGRGKIFTNTAGGAYSYISGKDRVYIPGANNNILRVTIKDRMFEDEVESIDIGNQVEAGNLIDPDLSVKDQLNQLTALLPDVEGNLWFTSRQGVIGVIERDEELPKGCPKIYYTFIGYFGLKEKLQKYYPHALEHMDTFENFQELDSVSPEVRKFARETLKNDDNAKEEIQNSFSVGKDGVYIVSNYALYKLRFNKETKKIEMDPEWKKNFQKGDLVYANNREIKPGHLNAGSGTTPTLMDDRFVAICDNDEDRINLCIFRQDNGELVSKLPLFGDEGSAVENSAVAYEDTFIVANTYGFTDPFNINPTPGGIMKFEYNKTSDTFEPVEGWPKSGVYDCKTATPKLSTRTGMLYVYNRDEEGEHGHQDWQITGIDYRTGLRVISTKLYFNKGDFKDNINFFMRAGSLGNKNYDRKVFNNIWGTFTFGPNNSFYIGTYRGFVKVSSD